MQEASTVHTVQHLFERGVEGMVAGQGNRTLTRRICEVMADALDYPLYHTKEVHCTRICICPQDMTIASTFHRLVDMNILVARRRLTGNSLEYGLAAHFAATLPQPPRFNVPKPQLRYMYPELNETSSDESSDNDE